MEHHAGPAESLTLYDRHEYEAMCESNDILAQPPLTSWVAAHARYRLPNPPDPTTHPLADEETLAHWLRSLVATLEDFALHFDGTPGYPYLALEWDVWVAPTTPARLQKYGDGTQEDAAADRPHWANMDDLTVICGGHRLHALPASPADDGSALLRDSLCGWAPSPFTPRIDLLHTLGLGCDSTGRLGARVLSDAVKRLQLREAAQNFRVSELS